MQCSVTSLPFISTLVPGRAEVGGRPFALSRPPSSCTSIEMGKSWSFVMLAADWEWTMMPLLRSAQSGAPGACSPTKRYSAATM